MPGKPRLAPVLHPQKFYATSFFNVFGGKYSGHYLARPYYAFYPTAQSKGPLHLSAKFKKKYPDTDFDWVSAVKTRHETGPGALFSYTFNIPVHWAFSYDDPKKIPTFKDPEALLNYISASPEMAAVLFDLNIPLEHYRWSSRKEGNKLLIQGKTTVLCVLAPILQDTLSGEYQRPIIEDRSMYQIL